MTPPRPRWALSGLLWGVAFLMLAMAGAVSPANRSGVAGVAILGFALTALAVGLDLASGRRGRRPDDAKFVTGVLAAFAAVEGLGLFVARAEGEANQAAWFAVALGFAAAGVLASWRGGASDGAIAAQLFFHGVLIIPAVAPVGKLIVAAIGTPEAVAAFAAAGPVARLLLIVGGVAMPPLFAGLLFALAYDFGRRDERRPPVWPALLIHEAAYVVIAARWSYDGI